MQAPGEFELIHRYFQRAASSTKQVSLGIGDDCALLVPRPGHELAISTDMLVEGRHFFAEVDTEALGWKALAVNLSDLAAMGAQPLAFTLALALPEANEAWLEKFSRGLFECADRYGCALIGGDTTRGPLNICITIFGEVPSGISIRRDGAHSGDDLWVSGTLGNAALGLQVLRDEVSDLDTTQRAAMIAALERPTPRIVLGLALRGFATAMIDVSDGLIGDLAHVLAASRVGARIEVDALPLSPALECQSQTVQWQCSLAGGDDYELCFTAPASLRDAVMAAARTAEVVVTRIGSIVAGQSIEWVDAHGSPYVFPDSLAFKSYDHFA